LQIKRNHGLLDKKDTPDFPMLSSYLFNKKKDYDKPDVNDEELA